MTFIATLVVLLMLSNLTSICLGFSPQPRTFLSPREEGMAGDRASSWQWPSLTRNGSRIFWEQIEGRLDDEGNHYSGLDRGGGVMDVWGGRRLAENIGDIHLHYHIEENVWEDYDRNFRSGISQATGQFVPDCGAFLDFQKDCRNNKYCCVGFLCGLTPRNKTQTICYRTCYTAKDHCTDDFQIVNQEKRIECCDPKLKCRVDKCQGCIPAKGQCFQSGDCCSNLICRQRKCQACIAAGSNENCASHSDCCPNLSCRQQKCQVCMKQNGVCNSYEDCCPGLTCDTINKKCIKLTGKCKKENEPCFGGESCCFIRASPFFQLRCQNGLCKGFSKPCTKTFGKCDFSRQCCKVYAKGKEREICRDDKCQPRTRRLVERTEPGLDVPEFVENYKSQKLQVWW